MLNNIILLGKRSDGIRIQLFTQFESRVFVVERVILDIMCLNSSYAEALLCGMRMNNK